MGAIPERTAAANVVPEPSPSRPKHRKLIPARSPATRGTTPRSNGREVLELEQVGAGVAALLAAVAVLLYFHHRDSPAARGGRGNGNLAVDVQEPHGPAPAPARPGGDSW